MKKLLFFIAITALFASCNVQKRQEKRCRKCENSQIISVHDTIREMIRDTFVVIDADTSNFTAYLECNEQNEVLLSQIKNYSSQGLKTVVVYKDKILTVTTTVDSSKVYFALKDKFSSKTDKENEIIKLPPEKIKYISFWQYCYIALFIILSFILGVIFSKQIKNICKIPLKM